MSPVPDHSATLRPNFSAIMSEKKEDRMEAETLLARLFPTPGCRSDLRKDRQAVIKPSFVPVGEPKYLSSSALAYLLWVDSKQNSRVPLWQRLQTR